MQTTSINAAAGLAYRAYNGTNSSERFQIDEPDRVMRMLVSSPPSAVSEEMKQRVLHASTLSALAEMPLKPADNSVAKIWGNIEVGGTVVAQIYQSGAVASKTAYQLPQKYWDSSSPAVRAQGMIEAYGGKLVMRDQMQEVELFKG